MRFDPEREIVRTLVNLRHELGRDEWNGQWLRGSELIYKYRT